MQQQDSCSMTPPNSPLVVVPMETQEVEQLEELKPAPGTFLTWQLHRNVISNPVFVTFCQLNQ